MTNKRFFTPQNWAILWGLLLLLCGNTSAHATEISDSAWIIPRDSNYLEWQIGYGQSQQDQNTYQEFRFRNHLELGFLQNANILLEWPFLTRSLRRPDQEPEYLINNGFTDLYLGSRIRLFQDNLWALALQPSIELPTGYNPSFLPVLGNAQLSLGLDLIAGLDFYPLEGYALFGMGYRMNNDFPKDHALLGLEPTTPEGGSSLRKPADRMRLFTESGLWLSENVFASLKLEGLLGLPQESALQQSQISFKPLLAWRLHPNFDISIQSEHSLWTQNAPALQQVLLGIHIRTGPSLDRQVGLRGGKTEYAEYDPDLP